MLSVRARNVDLFLDIMGCLSEEQASHVACVDVSRSSGDSRILLV